MESDATNGRYGCLTAASNRSSALPEVITMLAKAITNLHYPND
jgi:hypothetical protein